MAGVHFVDRDRGRGVFLAIAVAVPIVSRQKRKAELFLGTLAVGRGRRHLGSQDRRIHDVLRLLRWHRRNRGAGRHHRRPELVGVAEDAGHRRLALAVVIVCVLQLELGTATALRRLHHFGANVFEPIPVSLLTAIRSLPPDAKLAYACSPLEETSLGVPQLGSIDAHADRRIIPVCFNAEILSSLNGAHITQRPKPVLPRCPATRTLSSAALEPVGSRDSPMAFGAWDHTFLRRRDHPNRLSPGSRVVAEDGEASILQCPSDQGMDRTAALPSCATKVVPAGRIGGCCHLRTRISPRTGRGRSARQHRRAGSRHLGRGSIAAPP